MTSHPNRAISKAAAPAPEEIRAARDTAGLTQAQAAELVHSAWRTWAQWEAGDRRMHPALWELFRIKIDSATIFAQGAPRPSIGGGE